MNNKKILEVLSNMTVLELCELTRELENKWGMVGISQRVGFTGFPQVYEPIGIPINFWPQTEFSVKLKSFPSDKKILVLKVIREITGLSLSESKKLMDNLPQRVKEFISNLEANEIAAKFKQAGAEVEIE